MEGDCEMTTLKVDDYEVNSWRENTLNIKLPSPRPNKNKHVELDLWHNKVSDGIRISYDFEREGWVIKQPYSLTDAEWREVGFFKSWGILIPEERPEVI